MGAPARRRRWLGLDGRPARLNVGLEEMAGTRPELLRRSLTYSAGAALSFTAFGTRRGLCKSASKSVS